MKGGSVQNPIHALAQFIDGLHAPNGSVNVEGFYRYAKSRGRACLCFCMSEDVQQFCLAFPRSSMASGPWGSTLADRQIWKAGVFLGAPGVLHSDCALCGGVRRGRLRTGQVWLRFSLTRPLRWRAWAPLGPRGEGLLDSRTLKE